MWLVIRKTDNVVVGTQQGLNPAQYWDPVLYEIKEWLGPEPPEGNVDPTLADPDYPAFSQSKLDFDALADKANAEIDWLETNIPLVDDMTLEELRAFLKRVARENQETIRAWRYLFRRLAG